MTGGDDVRLRGRHPEFSRMSRGGRSKGSVGIGAPSVEKLVAVIEEYCSVDELRDVPPSIGIEKGRQMPLGRYMRRKMREALGLDAGAPEDVLREAWEEQVRPLLEMAKENSIGLKAAFAIANAGYEASLKHKAQRFKGRL